MTEDTSRPKDETKEPLPPDNGLGTLCHESQADGVPCCEPGRLCAKCERAWFRQEGEERPLHSQADGETPVETF